MRKENWVNRLYASIVNERPKEARRYDTENNEHEGPSRKDRADEYNILVTKLSQESSALDELRRKVIETKIQLLLKKGFHESTK